jgi:hypothetical protein
MLDLEEGCAHLDAKPPSRNVLTFGNRATTHYGTIAIRENHDWYVAERWVKEFFH